MPFRAGAAGSPVSQFERDLVGAFLAGAGHDVETILARTDERARQLLTRACAHASEHGSALDVRPRHLWATRATSTPHLYE
jgi:hypothetical protein